MGERGSMFVVHLDKTIPPDDMRVLRVRLKKIEDAASRA